MVYFVQHLTWDLLYLDSPKKKSDLHNLGSSALAGLSDKYSHFITTMSCWLRLGPAALRFPHLSSSGSRGPAPACSGTRLWSSPWRTLSARADRPRAAPCSHPGPAAPGLPPSPPGSSPRSSGSDRWPGAKGSEDHRRKKDVSCKQNCVFWLIFNTIYLQFYHSGNMEIWCLLFW